MRKKQKNKVINNRPDNLIKLRNENRLINDHLRSIREMIDSSQGTIDGLTNVISNIGTAKDKNSYNSYSLKLLSDNEMISLYRSSWIGARLADIHSFESTREWRYFTMQNDSSIIENLVDYETRLNFKQNIADAIRWSRVFGGAAIILGVDNTGPLDTPLIIESIQPDSLKFMHVVDRRFIYPILTGDEYYPGSPNFLNPEYYTTVFNADEERSSYRIHRSRIVKFNGVDLPMYEYIANQFWGDSVYTQVFNAISGAETVHSSISSMTQAMNVDIWYIKDLADTLRMKNGESTLSKRLQTNDLMKSINNSAVLDKDNELLDRKQISFGGLDSILEKFLTIVAAASGIPATKILGQSPDGLNASGEGDLRNFYDHIASYQEDVLKPKIQYLDNIIAMSALGFVPEDMKFEFNPLWQMSEKEMAEIQNMRAQRDSTYMRDGVLTSDIIAKELMIDETYQSLTDQDIKDLEDFGSDQLLIEELERQLAEGENNEKEGSDIKPDSTE